MSRSLKVLSNEVINLKEQNHLLIDKYDREIEDLKYLIKQSIRNHSKKQNIQSTQNQITNTETKYEIIKTINKKIYNTELTCQNNFEKQNSNFQKIDQEIQNIIETLDGKKDKKYSY